jgi:hypothetical protein
MNLLGQTMFTFVVALIVFLTMATTSRAIFLVLIDYFKLKESQSKSWVLMSSLFIVILLVLMDTSKIRLRDLLNISTGVFK